MIARTILILLALVQFTLFAAAPDAPFLQDRSEQYPAEGELAGATMKKVRINKDGIVYVLTDRGMARLFGEKLALDRSFRPFIGKKIIDSELWRGEIFYLFEDALLCNGFAGRIGLKLEAGRFEGLVSSTNGQLFLVGKGAHAFVNDDSTLKELKASELPTDVRLSKGSDASISVSRNGETWTGTPRGVYRMRQPRADYYASRRWLLDDHVIDLALDDGGNAYVLTETGLNKIVFDPSTLEQKARHYQEKIRKRHMRFGFCSELRLSRPGDPASAEMIDTDNDGTWTEYYMASQAFRYGATGDSEAHAHAWETFATMERLESINSLGGFPARTFERKGYKNSDPDRWRDRGDGLWEWKGHTSSDEITAHAFGCSVLYECAAKTAEEKQRIAAFIGKIVDHLLRNNLYLIDVDGKPTLWGRWNPEYVNWFPHTVFDRRLNSAEVVALLQFAYAMTGKAEYKAKGMELLEKYGYLENIMSSMSHIAYTKGYVHEGIELGTDWNHSDDLLAFDAYWVLYRYAFNNNLKKKYAETIRDHWELEKREKNPLWNFVYASTKPRDFDLEGALWTLRRFPLDMVDWTVRNSHRSDLTKLEPNFRQEQLKELLPPGERRITRWNSHPFLLDGGSGGRIELAGDEYLLPYWMGRYLKLIGSPKSDSKNQPVVP